LMAFAEDEDPIDRPENGEQHIANEGLPEATRRARRRIDRAHPQPPLANALSAGESIGKEIVEDGPGDPDQEQGGTKRVTDRGQDCTGDQRNPADETVEELAEQATG